MKMSSDIAVETFPKICRTCLNEGEMKPLFETCSNNTCLIEKIMSCTFIEIKEDDGLPVNICTNCINEINQAYTFAQKCETSDKTLRNCIAAATKQQNENVEVEKIKISSLRNIKRRDSLETKENKPIVQTIHNDDNDDEKIKSEIPDTKHKEENVSLEYIKLEDTGNLEDDYSDSNDNNDDSDFCPDKSENEEEKIKEPRRRPGRKVDRSKKEIDNNWDDDFSWKVDSPSDKKDIKAKKKRKSTPRRQGPPFICKRCDITFQTHEEIVEHRTKVRHYPPKNKPCPVCEKLFTTWKLKSHMRTHTKERPYLCSFCGKGFTLDTNLRRHLMIHTGERPHKCHMCEKAFIQMTQLQDHLRVHSGETPFVCSVCGKSFKQPSVLRLHMKHKHSEEGESLDKRKKEGNAGKPIDPNAIPEHECPTCNKRYHTKAVLNQHLLTHGEKRFLCSDCGKGFISKASLQVHGKIHSGIRPYSCQVCGKSFSQMGSLQMHNLIHTGEKPNICLVCNKSFTQPSHLKYHMRTHTGEKPYSCTVCGKNFSTSGTLTVHKRTHTGETPYLCPICGKGFYDSSSMKKHKRRHGEQNTTPPC